MSTRAWLNWRSMSEFNNDRASPKKPMRDMFRLSSSTWYIKCWSWFSKFYIFRYFFSSLLWARGLLAFVVVSRMNWSISYSPRFSHSRTEIASRLISIQWNFNKKLVNFSCRRVREMMIVWKRSARKKGYFVLFSPLFHVGGSRDFERERERN